MFFVEVMGCTLNMCLLGYYFITVTLDTFIISIDGDEKTKF